MLFLYELELDVSFILSPMSSLFVSVFKSDKGAAVISWGVWHECKTDGKPGIFMYMKVCTEAGILDHACWKALVRTCAFQASAGLTMEDLETAYIRVWLLI